MRKPKFTDKEIIQAGVALEQEGRRVTGVALRRALGGGSIPRLLRVWQAYKTPPQMYPLDSTRPDLVIKVRAPQSDQTLKVRVENGCLVLLTGSGTEIAVPVFAQEGREEGREAEAAKHEETREEGKAARQVDECESGPEADPTKKQEENQEGADELSHP